MHISTTRDEIMAEDVAAMAALGKFEREFTVFGCAFWHVGEMVLALSEDAEKIYDWIYDVANADKFVTGIHKASLRSLVPAGTEEYLLEQARHKLITTLRTTYSKEYFQLLEKINAVAPTDQAADLLQDLCYQLDGVCSKEQLMLFRGFVEKAWQRKVIKPSTYYKLLTWVRWTERDLNAFPERTDKYEKIFYGFAYCKPETLIRVFLDGNKVNAYEKMEERRVEGYSVSNLVEKTCWYNNSYNIIDAKRDCESYFNKIFDDTYKRTLLLLEQMESPLQRDIYVDALAWYSKSGKNDIVQALERQGKIWKL